LRSTKLAALVIALAFVAACGGSSTAQNNTPKLGALKNKVTVTFWHALPGNLETALKAEADAFNKSQDLVTVQLVNKGTYATLRQALLTALAAGSGIPDMAQCIENHAAKYNQSGALADLGPYMNADDGLSSADMKDIFPTMLKDGQINGKYVMFPFNKSATVLYYNQDMFAAAGISSPPATWDEFFADAHKLTAPDGSHWGVDYGSIDMWISMLYEFGGQLYNSTSNPTKGTFNGSAGKLITQKWHDAVAAKDAQTVSGPGFPDQVHFQTGKIAMYLSTQVSYQFLVGPIGSKFKFAEAPLPAGPGGVKNEIMGANACVFSKSSADVQHGAFLFVKYFTNQVNTANWAKTSSYMPLRQSAYNDLASFYAQHPEQAVGVGMLQKGQMFTVPFTSSFDDQRTEMGNDITAAIEGRKDIQTELDTAAQKVSDLLTTG
jgi:multiple sugar transport system substrate-binding protein